jgi:hypothetical protein
MKCQKCLQTWRGPKWGLIEKMWTSLRKLKKKKMVSRCQSYKNLISSYFSLSVCRTGKYCLYIKMAKRNSKKLEKSLFYEEKSLVGLTPARLNPIKL